MSEETNKPKKLSLSGSGKLSLGGGAVDPANLRGGMVGSGRGKTVQVEVRRKRVGGANVRPAQPNTPAPAAPVEEATPAPDNQTQQGDGGLPRHPDEYGSNAPRSAKRVCQSSGAAEA